MRETGDDDPPDGDGSRPPDTRMETQDISLTLSGQPVRKLKRPATGDTSHEPKKLIPPSVSNQSVYVKDGFESDSKLSYNKCDNGPFIIHVSRSEPDVSAGHSIRLLKFAQLIHRNKVTGIVEGGIKSLGGNRVCLEFRSADDANLFINNEILSANVANVPRFHISRMGVVKDIPTDWSLEELVEGIKTPSNCGQVIRARRLNVKSRRDDSVTWIPSTSVVLTFLGQTLPERIFCYLPFRFLHISSLLSNAVTVVGLDMSIHSVVPNHAVISAPKTMVVIAVLSPKTNIPASFATAYIWLQTLSALSMPGKNQLKWSCHKIASATQRLPSDSPPLDVLMQTLLALPALPMSSCPNILN